MVFHVYCCSLKLLRRKRIKMATKIQTVWRLVRAKRRVSRLKKQNIDARILTRKLNRLCKKHKFHIKYIWRQQRTPYAVRIQALFRRALARTRVRRLLSAQRKIADTRLFITTRLNQLMAATQLQLVRDTLSVPIGKRTFLFFPPARDLPPLRCGFYFPALHWILLTCLLLALILVRT
jgi:hypothetical protein